MKAIASTGKFPFSEMVDGNPFRFVDDLETECIRATVTTYFVRRPERVVNGIVVESYDYDGPYELDVTNINKLVVLDIM